MATSRVRLPLVITLGLPVSVLVGLACARSQQAESVFNTIKVMRGMPAGRLLSIMDVGAG